MSSSMNIDAPTSVLSTIIWCEIVNSNTLRIRCNYCEVDFYEGLHYQHVEPGNDWLGDAISHIVSMHPEYLA